MRGISGCTQRLIAKEEELAGMAMAMGFEAAAPKRDGEGRGKEEEQGPRGQDVDGGG
jgi:hypothetical protein